MRNSVICLLIISALHGCGSPEKTWELFSPDQNLRATLSLDEEKGILSYQVSMKSEETYSRVVDPSPLGLVTDKTDLSKDLSWLQSSEIQHIDESYEMLSGKKSQFRNEANEMAITFSNPEGKEIMLQFRAYDDGFAFRYIPSGPVGEEMTILEECTGFTIPPGSKAWMPRYDTASGTTPGYETLYTNGSPSGMDAPQYSGWSFPALFKSGPAWLLISESNVYNFCGIHLDSAVNGGTYKVRFPEPDERFGTGSSNPSSLLPWQTPWRFILVGKDLNTIVRSGMVTHLAEPNKLDDTGWIKPGRASWSWWSSTGRGRELETLKDFTDLAVEMGWEYTLVDAGWENMKGGTLEDLIDYAGERGVGVWIWYNSGGRIGGAFGMTKYIMEDPQLRKKEMQRIHDLGVKGVKIDFFNSDKQHIMKLYQDILEDAAENELMVNFHGCTLPRGWRRTYPNLLSMEAIKGGENYRYDPDFPDNAPWMNTLAFLVRNSVGPMDYTPVMFGNQRYAHKTTPAHELATAVLFESGILHFADHASSYRRQDKAVKEFLSGVPNTWEDIFLVDASPGEYAVVARKSKDNVWYLAGINGKNSTLPLTFAFEFLEEGKTCTARLFQDGDSATIVSGTSDLSRDLEARLTLAPYGGFVYVIEEN